MIYIYSFLAAITIAIILWYLKVPDFLVGWGSCMGYSITIEYIEHIKSENKT